MSHVKHQGIKDIERHSETKMHLKRLASLKNQYNIGVVFKPKHDPIQDKVTSAEVRIAIMLAQHNAPQSMADHIGPMLKTNFSDSSVAKLYQCARTKTTCILNCAVAPMLQSELVADMKHLPHSLIVDASNDSGMYKMNPVTVRIYDASSGTVMQKFLDLCLTSGTDAGKTKDVFDKIDFTLTTRGISWSNCIALGLDNTNTNIGQRNSIKSRAVIKNSAIYVVGCPCHIIHNTPQKAAKAFNEETGFDVEECCVDHYYWFDKSTRRKGQLCDYAAFCDSEYRQFIKHINVRWLSLEKAVNRILQMYSGTKSYYLSEHCSKARFKRLKVYYENDITELYLMFY